MAYIALCIAVITFLSFGLAWLLASLSTGESAPGYVKAMTVSGVIALIIVLVGLILQSNYSEIAVVSFDYVLLVAAALLTSLATGFLLDFIVRTKIREHKYFTQRLLLGILAGSPILLAVFAFTNKDDFMNWVLFPGLCVGLVAVLVLYPSPPKVVSDEKEENPYM